MAGNTFPVNLHSTFSEKVRNFPDDIYNFNDGDNLTTLMKILLGNSGTGQLRNLQIAAKISQQYLEYSNLDYILGQILNVQRISPEIYSFATNPFIDQLTDSQWQEVRIKDSNYRERLLGAAEAFQTGCTLWGIKTLCEALTGLKFYVVESWRTPGYGRSTTYSGSDTSSVAGNYPGVLDPAQEIVLIPILDSTNNSGTFTWDQSKKQAILQSIYLIGFANFSFSFGAPIQNLTQYPLSYVVASGYSENFLLQPTVTSNLINTPSTIAPGAGTRYWIKNNTNNIAPYFSHLQTQEETIDMTGNIISANVSDLSSYISSSIANPSLQVTSTVYGAQ
jgi:hypothetical protein